jgi:hypothetical protein
MRLNGWCIGSSSSQELGISNMALRVARGLFRLWLVLSVLWIGGVGVVTWRTFPVDDWFVPDPIVPGSTADICSTAKNAEQCSDLLRAAGKNPFDAYDLNWDGHGSSWIDKERREAIQFASIVALVPPTSMLALGSALVWAFRGFR